MISSIRNFMCALPNEFPNDLGPRILGNKETLGRSQACMGTQASAQTLLQK